MQLQNTSLDRLNMISKSMLNETLQSPDFTLVANGQTNGQIQANNNLNEALSLLNQRAGNTYLFSGSATDTPATDTVDHILNGNGTAAGLKQVISERLQADQGSDGRGRLDAPTAAGDRRDTYRRRRASLRLQARGREHRYRRRDRERALGLTGFALDRSSAAPIRPMARPCRSSSRFPTALRARSHSTASSAVPTPNGSFAIGVDATATAANLASVLDTKIQALAKTDLAAASAVEASNEFFNINATHPPQRVDGPPFDTATALRDATATDTVRWYTGDDATNDPRATMSARVDDAITVNYGIRGNEEALRNSVQNFATFAAVSFSAGDPSANARYNALAQRIGANLAPNSGVQQISSIQTEIAGANLAANAAKTRIEDKKPILQGVLDSIENADPNEVGVQLLALQTQMQASLQTTAMLSKLSLVNFM